MDSTKLEAKLDQVASDIAEVKMHAAVQNSQLAYHIRRTDLLEERLTALPARALLYLSLLSGIVGLITKLT